MCIIELGAGTGLCGILLYHLQAKQVILTDKNVKLSNKNRKLQGQENEINKKESFFVGDAVGRNSDYSDVDLKFAENIGIKCFTPEEIFFDDKYWSEMLVFFTYLPDLADSIPIYNKSFSIQLYIR